MNSVRGTLLALGLGTAVQRLCQLLAMLVIAHALGGERTGCYAQAVAAATMASVLAGSGVRSHVAREVARAPARLGGLLRAAVRARLLVGAVLFLPFAAGAALAAEPWLWLCCGLLLLPAAFDLKGVLDAALRARAEIALDSTASLLHLGAVLAWSRFGGGDLGALAALLLGSRCLYAAGAARAIRALPVEGPVPGAVELLRQSRRTAVGQTVYEAVLAGDVTLVAAFGGDAAAGCYAVAQRLASAAAVPAVQLGRLLQPHLLRAAAAGDPAAAARTAWRALSLVLLPLLAGGSVVAEPLCRLFGADFAAAAWPLRAMLLGLSLQHLGWQCGQTLFAGGRDRAYLGSLWGAASAHLLLSALLVPGLGAAGGGAAFALAHAGYLAVGVVLQQLPLRPLATAWPGLLTAAATAGASAAAGWLPLGNATLPAQLIAGAAAFAAGVWWCELRGRWRRIGEGLLRASGLS